MLSAILHRERRPAAAAAVAAAGGAVRETRKLYGTQLLVRGLLWVSVYLLSRGLLELDVFVPAAPAHRRRAATDTILRAVPS